MNNIDSMDLSLKLSYRIFMKGLLGFSTEWTSDWSNTPDYKYLLKFLRELNYQNLSQPETDYSSQFRERFGQNLPLITI